MFQLENPHCVFLVSQLPRENQPLIYTNDCDLILEVLVDLTVSIHDLGQWSKEKGFSPVCVLLCLIKWLECENDFGHWSQ